MFVVCKNTVPSRLVLALAAACSRMRAHGRLERERETEAFMVLGTWKILSSTSLLELEVWVLWPCDARVGLPRDCVPSNFADATLRSCSAPQHEAGA